MLSRIFLFAVFSFLLSCSNKSTQSRIVEYSGNEVVIEELYFQNEIAGSQKGGSRSYLHLKLKINTDEGLELKSLEYKEENFPLDGRQLEYKLEYPKEVVYGSDRIRPAILYFNFNGTDLQLKRIPDYKEDLFLP